MMIIIAQRKEKNMEPDIRKVLHTIEIKLCNR
jgi:hypothetical protein